MSDGALLRLEAEFNVASAREEKGADGVEELEAEIDRLEAEFQRERRIIRDRINKAEAKKDRRTEEASRLFAKIMKTRATSLAGMLAKVRVRKLWNWTTRRVRSPSSRASSRISRA
jgi:hypothetical protein